MPGPLLALEPLSNAVVANWSQCDHVAATELKCRNILVLCFEDSLLAQKKKMSHTFFIKLKLTKEKHNAQCQVSGSTERQHRGSAGAEQPLLLQRFAGECTRQRCGGLDACSPACDRKPPRTRLVCLFHPHWQHSSARAHTHRAEAHVKHHRWPSGR